MNENVYKKCRTCLAVGAVSTKLSQIINNTNTRYKNVLLQLVPQMETTLFDSDTVCFACKNVLKTVSHFIDQCMEVEEQLAVNLPEDVVMEKEGEELKDIDGTAEIHENIEIIVQNEGETSEVFPQNDQSTAQSEGSSDPGSLRIHDHAYIKSEIEEGEIRTEDDSGNYKLYIGSEEIKGEGGTSEVFPQNDQSIHDHAYIKSEIEEGEIHIEDDSGNYKLYIGDGSEEIKSEGEAEGEVLPYAEDDSEEFVKQEMKEEDSMDMITIDENGLWEENFMCDVCGLGFKNVSLWTKHLSTHEEKRVKCPICPKVFKSEVDLNRHKSIVHKPDELGVRFMCAECNKLFKNKVALNAHFKLKHLKLDPYKCDICDETFGRADYLKKHRSQHVKMYDKKSKTRSKVPGMFIRFKYTDDPIACKICGKYYNGVHKLKYHLKTHVVAKRYACEYCDLTYKRWRNLKRHEKTHLESDETFHRCNVCWKRLQTQDELTVHMAQHKNPRYRCHICDELFHRKYLFDNHFLLQHATPEDLEISKKEVIYDTLLELTNQSS